MITYEPVSKQYDFLYELLKERPKEACISHHRMPTMEEHIAYVDSWPDRFSEYFVIRCDGELCGSTYLTHKNEHGMFILKAFSGRGIARATFAWIRRNHPGEKLYSNVNPRNRRIKRILKGIGCKLIQETYEHP